MAGWNTNQHRRIDIAGQRFGRLVAVSWLRKLAGQGQRSTAGTYWICRCDCGGRTIVPLRSLRSGLTRSCGCLRCDAASRTHRQHGLSRTPEYDALINAIRRCHDPSDPQFDYYGGRGIAVCVEWLKNPRAFCDHIGPRPSPKHSLDRIDNGGNYQPGNVRWATAREQALNRRPRSKRAN